MPVAPVNRNGDVVLYYEDSGAPDTHNTYVTVILIHGAVFHSGSFRRMVPYAAKNNLRFIAVNERDYPGSSPFSSEELAAMSNPDKAEQARALQKQAEEIAEFMVHIIKKYDIPAASSSGGGLALLGWSLGSLLPLAFLANADKYPPGHTELLGRYLRTVVLHDPSVLCVGEAPPIVETSISNWPLLNPQLPLDERLRIFPIWASSYFTPVNDLLSLTLPTLAARVVVDQKSADEPLAFSFAPSVSKISTAELESITYPDALIRLMEYIDQLDISVFRDSFLRAIGRDELNDKTHEAVSSNIFWPDCKVLLTWCDMTTPDCMFTSAHIAKTAQEGHTRRQVKVVRVERANHFVHWDDPERFAELLAHHI